ncbi:four helix bundle protein [Candidatus Roizmanbacteria bacterium CG_4_10_14_0_2_um_filter_36_35]|uniref:Four helix bundle protein n=3 Tax=Candidatus Roizmaniibacteriota TaxID=1752723 RepID=A0A2M7BWM0_9BACT|nr:MAG: four helix bundle protein [Candidatus Roizmanbacteria bacterium CG11_big_fil_rev_8_21_14_0_20_35_14]PIV10930.1 MAG: four helix bundle protein [Candidatus Roizmanbacteria bacterium CG03_land_8_20_14_0_80_35_26]PIZ68633.1 MAG: four helix bundle protein [Candidatus Roizmanbacteria bacterium CG_4_10_14_0_2_um_filter_36_35]PJC80906.1 MAG: four helix bundle protein [Candidatus Roizmanbacteria bacterium CG_4_8_14_3_um_filter_36_12]
MSNLKSQIYISNVKSTNVKVRAYQFSIKIIKFVNKLPSKRAFWVIGDQLIRSATSIGANMMEGQSSSSRREFIKYYEISLKSSNETKYWLSLLKDSFVELKNEIEILLKENEEISRMIASSILTLKNKNRY